MATMAPDSIERIDYGPVEVGTAELEGTRPRSCMSSVRST